MFTNNYKNIFDNFLIPYSRQDASEKILNYFWPNYDVIWINSTGSYDNIVKTLSTKSKDVIILQTEEDWFKMLDIHKLRTTIANHPRWTNNSFLITNSEEDCNISKEYIKCVHKPGILDLVCYQPYNDIELDISKIKYHSSFLYSRKDKSREGVVKLLEHFKDKISICVYDHEVIFSNIGNLGLIEKKQPLDSPFIKIENDLVWSDTSAFHIVTETFNDFVIDPQYIAYTPTLSEKTFRAMHLMRPAIVFGGTGTRKKLKNLGFDTWDWLINWDFDKEKDPKTSYTMFLLEIKRLLSINIEDLKILIQNNVSSLINNRNRVHFLVNNYDTDF